jgi:hypothetical protein
MRTFRFLLAAVLLAMIPASLRAQSAPPAAAKPDSTKIDVTGKWNFSIEPFNGTPTINFTQKGDSISGEYISNALGTHKFVGTVKAGKIAFAFDAESGGQKFTMSFRGKVDDADTMSGTIDFSGMADGTFAGKRAKP